MTTTERKKKKPPTFRYLPKTSAKRLKKSWVEDHKIRSKWKAQKRREHVTNQTSAPVENVSSHADDKTNDDAGSEADADTIPTPPHEKQSLCDLSHASEPILTQKSYSSRPKRVSPPSRNNPGGTVRRETGQPNMKLRMNVLLEKIKRNST